MTTPTNGLNGLLAGFAPADVSEHHPDPENVATSPPTALLQPADSRRVADLMCSVLSDLRDDFEQMAKRIAVAVELAAQRSTQT